MLLQDQRKLEHRIEVIIAIGSIILGFFSWVHGDRHMDILMLLQFIGACAAVTIVGFCLAHLLDDTRKMDEAERRHKGILLQDETQAAELMRRYNECRERMGKDCCLHPEYRFNEKHRQIVGRE